MREFKRRPAEKGLAAIDNEQLAVISLNILKRMKPAKRMEPLELDAGVFELAANGSERREGPECAHVQSHLDVVASLGCEGGGKAPSHLIWRENVPFHSDVTLRAFDGTDHCVVELVAFGKELEGAMPFAARWQANPPAHLQSSPTILPSTGGRKRRKGAPQHVRSSSRAPIHVRRKGCGWRPKGTCYRDRLRQDLKHRSRTDPVTAKKLRPWRQLFHHANGR